MSRSNLLFKGHTISYLNGFVYMLFYIPLGIWHSVTSRIYIQFVWSLIWICIVHILFMLFIFIYWYYCQTRFPYQMMFVSFNTNTTGVTCGSETSDIFRGTRCSCCSTFSFLCSVLWVVCLSLCTFSLAYCVFSSSIYGFWLPLWYLQTFPVCLCVGICVTLLHFTVV